MKRRGASALLRKESAVAWVMMAPALIILCAVAVYPVLRTFWLSLHEMNLKEPGTGYPFTGLANYIQIFGDSRATADILFTLR